MASKPVLSDYIGQAMEQAEYDKLDDGSYGATIPGLCRGSGIRRNSERV